MVDTSAWFERVGFTMAEKSASNYRLLRSKGVTVRKTIDVLIGTFCASTVCNSSTMIRTST